MLKIIQHPHIENSYVVLLSGTETLPSMPEGLGLISGTG